MQKPRFIIGSIGAGFAIALVMLVGTLTSSAADQPAKPLTGSMMGTSQMDDMMTNMMSMDTMMQCNMMDQMMGSNYVHMGMHKFMPSDMRAKAGTTVTWQNHDHVVHNVVGVYKTDSGDKIWVRSPDLSHMDSWSYTFSKPGTFEYVCSYHESEGMRGKVIVSS